MFFFFFFGLLLLFYSSFFFFNDTATTEIYTLSLHDALPISIPSTGKINCHGPPSTLYSQRTIRLVESVASKITDRKSTRLNSSHGYISYAVFCLKKKKKKKKNEDRRRNPRPHS